MNSPAYVPINEGFFRHVIDPSVPPWSTSDSSQDMWYDVPYGVMTPKTSQASNLLVPVAISASAVAFTSARIETMLMGLGSAAGVAAGLIVDAGGPLVLPVQSVPLAKVQDSLVNTFGQRVRW